MYLFSVREPHSIKFKSPCTLIYNAKMFPITFLICVVVAILFYLNIRHWHWYVPLVVLFNVLLLFRIQIRDFKSRHFLCCVSKQHYNFVLILRDSHHFHVEVIKKSKVTFPFHTSHVSVPQLKGNVSVGRIKVPWHLQLNQDVISFDLMFRRFLITCCDQAPSTHADFFMVRPWSLLGGINFPGN